MKIVTWGVVAVLCWGAALLKAQEVPTSETLDTFNWTSEEVAPLIADRANTYSRFIPSFPTQLPLNYSGISPRQFTLRTLGPAVVSRITAKHYAIIGKLRYSNVTSGSYLEMWSYFAPAEPGGPEGAYFTRTLGDSGPMAKLEGTNDGSDFALPFDATGAKTKLVRLVMNLHLAGPGSVTLSDVKLVQYPDAPAAVAQTSPDTNSAALFSEAQTLMNLTADNAQVPLASVEGQPGVMKPRIGSVTTTLWQISYPPVTEGTFAVVGEIRYDNVGDGFLKAGTGWTPVNEPNRFTMASTFRTDQAQGPFGRLTGTSDWRPFWLPCGPISVDPQLASSPIKLKVLDITLALALGKGNVYLRNVKLVQCHGDFPKSWTPPGTIIPPVEVQYPSPPPRATPTAPQTQGQVGSLISLENTRALCWIFFFAGMVTTALVLLLARGLGFLFRRIRHRQKERELRRIASLDS